MGPRTRGFVGSVRRAVDVSVPLIVSSAPEGILWSLCSPIGYCVLEELLYPASSGFPER